MKSGKMNLQNKDILFLVHRVYKDGIVKKGGADYIADYLRHQGFGITTIEHPLTSHGSSFIKKNEKIVKEIKIIGNGPIRWTLEVFFNFFFARSSKKHYKLILISYLLKKEMNFNL